MTRDSKGRFNSDQRDTGWTADSISKFTGLVSSIRNDGWMNVLTGLGIAARDKRLGATFSGGRRLSMEKELMDEMFHHDDIVATICELPAAEMTREWFDLLIQPSDSDYADTDTADKIMGDLDAHQAQPKVKEALVWARLHGGCLLFLGVDDGQRPDKEVDLSSVRSLDFITVLDRHDVRVAETYDDPLGEKYKEPKFYEVSGGSSSSFGKRIHESRVLRFDGVLTGRRRRGELDGWGESVITRMYDVIRDFHSAYDGTAHILTDFSQAVFKIEGLSKMLASDKDGLVLQRLQMLDIARSIARAVPLDANEEFERKGASVAGMADLLDQQMMRLSAASRIPVTLLMGRSPAGLNATGESDIRLFYDYIRSQQEWQLRPQLEWLMTIMLNASEGPTGGVEPDQWGIEFNPLWQVDPKTMSEARKNNAQTDSLYIQNGVLTADEVAASRFGGDEYNPDTMLDKEKREREGSPSMMMAKGQGGISSNPLTGVSENTMQVPEGRPDRPEVITTGENKGRADGKEDAPSYGPPDPELAMMGVVCSGCMFAAGNLCTRYDFIFENGNVCYDFKARGDLVDITRDNAFKPAPVRSKKVGKRRISKTK